MRGSSEVTSIAFHAQPPDLPPVPLIRMGLVLALAGIQKKGGPVGATPSCSLLLHELTPARAVVATVATDDRPCGECMPGHRSVRQRL